ncbi:unnamed protein product [Effrenium voratum]|nr:unnamed protein product [Effrenium voratum]
MQFPLVALCVSVAFVLQGCGGNGGGSDKPTCSMARMLGALAQVVPCNRSTPKPLAHAPVVVLETFTDKEGLRKVTLQLGEQKFGSSKRSDFQVKEKYSQVHLQALKGAGAICIAVVGSPGTALLVAEDLSCPTCKGPGAPAQLNQWLLTAQEFATGIPCPEQEQGEQEQGEGVSMNTSKMMVLA